MIASCFDTYTTSEERESDRTRMERILTDDMFFSINIEERLSGRDLWNLCASSKAFHESLWNAERRMRAFCRHDSTEHMLRIAIEYGREADCEDIARRILHNTKPKYNKWTYQDSHVLIESVSRGMVDTVTYMIEKNMRRIPEHVLDMAFDVCVTEKTFALFLKYDIDANSMLFRLARYPSRHQLFAYVLHHNKLPKYHLLVLHCVHNEFAMFQVIFDYTCRTLVTLTIIYGCVSGILGKV